MAFLLLLCFFLGGVQLYCCFCHYEGSRVPGQYQEIHDAMPLAVEGDQGAGSPSWLFLTQAFEVLEEDFTRFDLSGLAPPLFVC